MGVFHHANSLSTDADGQSRFNIFFAHVFQNFIISLSLSLSPRSFHKKFLFSATVDD
jgi:hypothetical protein